jgi:uncharacterized protein (DUF2062 family)
MKDNFQTKKSSKRFTPSTFSERWVPILLGILVLALLATLVIVILAVLGLTPGV